VPVPQLTIRRTLMITTIPSKCKTLIIRSKNQQIPICKTLNPMKMSCAASTKAKRYRAHGCKEKDCTFNENSACRKEIFLNLPASA